VLFFEVYVMPQSFTIQIDGMSCAGCASTLQTKLNLIAGVKADVNYALASARVILSERADCKDVKKTLIDSNYQHDQDVQLFTVSGWNCSRCTANTIDTLLSHSRVLAAEANIITGKLTVTSFCGSMSTESISELISQLGYTVELELPDPENIAQDKAAKKQRSLKHSRQQKYLLGLSIALMLPFLVTMLAMLLGVTAWVFPVWLQLVCATIVQFVIGKRFYKGAWHTLKSGTANMDVLVVTGTSAAYFYSLYLFTLFGEKVAGQVYFEASVVVITLISLGKYLEENAKQNTSSAIHALMQLRPDKARVLRNDNWEMLALNQIKVDDIIRVLAGEKIPLDGDIVLGCTEVDESMVTGESLPVVKAIDDSVIGGSLNGSGTIDIRANAIGADSCLQKIINLVENAQMSKAPFQQLVDRVSAVFVPVVLVIALLTLLSWWFIIGDFEAGLISAVAVLVIACPCALGLATPAAVVTGTGLAAQQGILIKDIDTLQKAHRVTDVMLDKTGTLTQGQPQVARIDLLDENKNIDCIAYAAALQEHSEHPLAKAIVNYAQQYHSLTLTAKNVKTLVGYGIQGEIEGLDVLVGSAEFIVNNSIVIPKQQEDLANEYSDVFVAVDGQCMAIIRIKDELRAESLTAIQQLQKHKISPTILSGDNLNTVTKVAKELAITHYFAKVKPQQKAEHIQRHQQQAAIVAMVGDGINDAPALAQADVSIAMGSGTDVAMETANITLLRNDPRLIMSAISISKLTWRKIQQNLFWAFFFNIIGIPLAAMGYLSPEVAGAAMAFSSIAVLSNSLLIKRWQPLASH